MIDESLTWLTVLQVTIIILAIALPTTVLAYIKGRGEGTNKWAYPISFEKRWIPFISAILVHISTYIVFITVLLMFGLEPIKIFLFVYAMFNLVGTIVILTNNY